MFYALQTNHYRLQRLEEVYPLASQLASRLPNSTQYVTALYELLLNALEHGNLAIGANQKELLLRDGKWETEINRRLACASHKQLYVDVTLIQNHDQYKIIIRDQGEGFEWREYMMRAAQHCEIHGRGLSIALSAKFDRIFYNAAGNQVTCTIQHCAWAPSPSEWQLMRWNAPLTAKQWAI